ncbi:MAG: hypothetical protein IT547_02160 [Hyphomonadaceae bacterium]|jgi:hypothetical protein|nr:hypothetical protein [Hyphomonadaceae bacterium]
MSALRAVRDLLWLLMVERAEALNDAVVLGQRDARRASAKSIAIVAADLAALARAAAIIRSTQR